LAFSNPSMAAAFQASSAASQFAAGFAAATALSHQQLRQMLGSLGVPTEEQPQQQQQFQPPAAINPGNPFGN
jgi:hypothetical protein